MNILPTRKNHLLHENRNDADRVCCLPPQIIPKLQTVLRRAVSSSLLPAFADLSPANKTRRVNRRFFLDTRIAVQ